MKIKDIALSAAYVGQRVVKAICVGAQEVWSAIKYIVFKDPVVAQICVANFSSDGVGVTEEDAAKVTSFGTIFMENTDIVSFDELSEFVNLGIIRQNAFLRCTNLSSIVLPQGLYLIENRVFQYCEMLESINIPPLVKVIDASTFYDCKSLKSVTFESDSNLTSIGTTAFYGCESLISLSIPSSVTELGVQAFYRCKSIIFEVTIPKGVTVISASVFESCVGLPKAIITDDSLVTEIGGQAFMNCSSLKDINLREGITIMGQGCLRSCTTLQSVILPSTLTSLGRVALYGCTSLQNVICNAIVPPTSGDKVFDATNNCPIYVPDDSVDAYKSASNWSAYADRIKPLSLYVES